MAAGVAAVAAVREAGRRDAGLKWPNDVVAGGRKLGGILVESALAGREVTSAVAGIGLNVNLPATALGAFPDAALAPTTLLDLAGRPVSREALLLACCATWGASSRALYRQEPAEVLARYRQALTLLGSRGTGDAGARGRRRRPRRGIAEAVTRTAPLCCASPQASVRPSPTARSHSDRPPIPERRERWRRPAHL